MTNDAQPILPLDVECVEIPLTEDQIAAFAGAIELQQLRPGSQHFFVLASSYVPEERRGILRLQGKLVGKRTAAKALRILRSPEANL